MSTQQARNIVNNQIDNLITRAKTEIKNDYLSHYNADT